MSDICPACGGPRHQAPELRCPYCDSLKLKLYKEGEEKEEPLPDGYNVIDARGNYEEAPEYVILAPEDFPEGHVISVFTHPFPRTVTMAEEKKETTEERLGKVLGGNWKEDENGAAWYCEDGRIIRRYKDCLCESACPHLPYYEIMYPEKRASRRIRSVLFE